MKTKKSIMYPVLLILIIAILDRCTVVNITSSIFEKKEFKSYPFLKDGVSSDNYEIKHIVNRNYYGLEVVYDTINNYFLVDFGYSGLQKINAKGEALVYKGYHPRQSHYVFGKDKVIYNLSKNENQEEELSKIIPTDNIKNFENWFGFYTSYYEKADIVIYQENLNDNTNLLSIYLKINNEWILILISRKLDDELSINPKDDFPAKYRKLIYLKDYENKVYSIKNPSRALLPWKKTKVKTSKETIKKMFFKKEIVYDRLNLHYFNLFPIRFRGVAFYNLKKKEEVLKFKNTLHKSILVKDRAVLYHFTLPQQFKNKSQISFINYDPYVGNEVPGEGLYIIKSKKQND